MGDSGFGTVSDKRITFVDLLVAGGVKYFGEQLLAPYIGNGTIQSGVIKIVGAKFLGHHLPKPVKLALAIDGAEDIIVGLLGSGGLSSILGGARGETAAVI